MSASLKKSIIFLGLFLILLFSAGFLCAAENQQPTEHEIKVAFIYNFAKFVKWPESPRNQSKKSIDLYIIGSGFPMDALELINGKQVQGKTLIVKKTKSLSDIKDPEMIFICQSERWRLGYIITMFKALPVLTIGDTEGFAEKGVIINLYTEENRIRFEINIDAARQAGLIISSQLLKLARIIHASR